MTIDGTQTAPAGEDKQWADLAAEVEVELPEEEVAEPGNGGGGDKIAAEPEPAVEQPKPIPYEEMNRRYQGTQSALKAARDEAQAAREQLKAFTGMVEEMRSRRQETQPAPVKEEPKEPDPYEDPIGYVNHHLAEIRKEVGASKQTAEDLRDQQRSQAEYKQFTSTVEELETQFAATTSDYHDAAKFLEEGRRAELAIMFPDTPQMDAQARQQGFQTAAQMRNAVFIQDAQTVAANAMRAGMNPAEAYYGLAKARGYKAAAPGQATAEKLALANGAIDAARRGTKAAKTLSGGGGQADNQLNVADLTDLYAEDPEAFDKEWEKMARSGRLG